MTRQLQEAIQLLKSIIGMPKQINVPIHPKYANWEHAVLDKKRSGGANHFLVQLKHPEGGVDKFMHMEHAGKHHKLAHVVSEDKDVARASFAGAK